MTAAGPLRPVEDGAERVLLQVSDLHFGTEQPPVVEALVALAEAVRPEIVLWSGDITQRARRAQFDAARRLMQRLAARHTLAVPGNHDIPLFDLPARLLQPYAGWRRVFGAPLEPVLDEGPWLIQCLASTRRWRHKHGQLSAQQVRRVAERLRAARTDQVRIVALHHPLHVLREIDCNDRVRGHATAAQAWSAAGADLVLGGHIHWPFCAPLPPPGQKTWVALAGTAVSHRVREGIPNSVNLLRLRPARPRPSLGLERWDFDAAQARFHLVQRRLLLPHGPVESRHAPCPDSL